MNGYQQNNLIGFFSKHISHFSLLSDNVASTLPTLAKGCTKWMLDASRKILQLYFEAGGLENSITSKQKELKVKVLQFFYRNTFSIACRPGYIEM
jgi:hypothetical protein